MTSTHLSGPRRAVRSDHAGRVVARLTGGGTCTAAQLADAVGPETARYAVARARPGSLPALDLAVLATATDANPAFRVRFAHARLCAVARHAAALGIEPPPGRVAEEPAAGHYATARRLESLAATAEQVAPEALPRGDQPVTDEHRARLGWCLATRDALASGLRRLGVDAPERM